MRLTFEEIKEEKLVFIGDIHGTVSVKKIKNLIEKNDLNKTKIIFLGDLFGRFKDEKELQDLFDYIYELSKKNENVIILRGNHENIPLKNLKKLLEIDAEIKEEKEILDSYKKAENKFFMLKYRDIIVDIEKFLDKNKIIHKILELNPEEEELEKYLNNLINSNSELKILKTKVKDIKFQNLLKNYIELKIKILLSENKLKKLFKQENKEIRKINYRAQEEVVISMIKNGKLEKFVDLIENKIKDGVLLKKNEFYYFLSHSGQPLKKISDIVLDKNGEIVSKHLNIKAEDLYDSPYDSFTNKATLKDMKKNLEIPHLVTVFGHRGDFFESNEYVLKDENKKSIAICLNEFLNPYSLFYNKSTKEVMGKKECRIIEINTNNPFEYKLEVIESLTNNLIPSYEKNFLIKEILKEKEVFQILKKYNKDLAEVIDLKNLEIFQLNKIFKMIIKYKKNMEIQQKKFSKFVFDNS